MRIGVSTSSSRNASARDDSLIARQQTWFRPRSLARYSMALVQGSRCGVERSNRLDAIAALAV